MWGNIKAWLNQFALDCYWYFLSYYFNDNSVWDRAYLFKNDQGPIQLIFKTCYFKFIYCVCLNTRMGSKRTKRQWFSGSHCENKGKCFGAKTKNMWKGQFNAPRVCYKCHVMPLGSLVLTNRLSLLPFPLSEYQSRLIGSFYIAY